MSHRTFRISLAALVALVILEIPSSSAQEYAPSGTVKCVKRTATLEPPRTSLPVLRAINGKEPPYETSRKLKPVCPEGEVPVTAVPATRYFPKGNPLIGPYAAPGPAHPLAGDFVNRNLLLPFDQVYWKREGTATQPAPKSVPDGGNPPCNGVAWFGTCYYYATAAEPTAEA